MQNLELSEIEEKDNNFSGNEFSKDYHFFEDEFFRNNHVFGDHFYNFNDPQEKNQIEIFNEIPKNHQENVNSQDQISISKNISEAANNILQQIQVIQNKESIFNSINNPKDAMSQSINYQIKEDNRAKIKTYSPRNNALELKNNMCLTENYVQGQTEQKQLQKNNFEQFNIYPNESKSDCFSNNNNQLEQKNQGEISNYQQNNQIDHKNEDLQQELKNGQNFEKKERNYFKSHNTKKLKTTYSFELNAIEEEEKIDSIELQQKKISKILSEHSRQQNEISENILRDQGSEMISSFKHSHKKSQQSLLQKQTMQSKKPALNQISKSKEELEFQQYKQQIEKVIEDDDTQKNKKLSRKNVAVNYTAALQCYAKEIGKGNKEFLSWMSSFKNLRAYILFAREFNENTSNDIKQFKIWFRNLAIEFFKPGGYHKTYLKENTRLQRKGRYDFEQNIASFYELFNPINPNYKRRVK